MSFVHERQKVMIVDDSVTNIEILNHILQDDYDILCATDGAGAIELIQEELPDLILLDVVMPQMDGYMVCRQLKSNPATMNIPVIFITAKTSIDDETKGLEAGAIDYITKPINPAIVKMRVRNQVELRRYQNILEKLSIYDGLTGIHNRRCFDEYFSQELRRARRSQLPLALIMMDVDYFKSYNDNYGHPMGDHCLKKVAGALSEALRRPGDMVARYGGEEFICILPETSLTGAVSVAANMQKHVKELAVPHHYSDVSPFVTLSYGVVGVHQVSNEQSNDIILSAADKQLYKAKKLGRNQYCYSELLG